MRFLSNCHERVSILYECDAQNQDTVAVTLRRWIANPLLIERESSNLSDVVNFILLLRDCLFCLCCLMKAMFTSFIHVNSHNHNCSQLPDLALVGNYKHTRKGCLDKAT